MGKFVIACPNCGTYHIASTSIFSKKYIECSCGYNINIKRDRMTTKECPHCKNVVAFDQAEKHPICPVCKEPLVTTDSMGKSVEIKCPSCFCQLTVDKAADKYVCPLCDEEIDVQAEIKKQDLKSEGIMSVIKYEGPNDVLVWKHPIEDFNYGSQLIVHESQEAILFKDGKALDLFGAGRYTISTANVPILTKQLAKMVNEDTIFHSEVYFINQTTQMGIKWGTDSKVRMFDPISGMHIEIGACGQFSIRVSNSRKLLLKLVGTSTKFGDSDILGNDYSTKAMNGKFKALVMAKVKSYLAKAIRENNINILEVDEYIDDISAVLKEKINAVLEEYGLTMPEFFITTILTPDDDPNFRRMKEQYAERYLKVQQEKIRKAEAEAAQERKIVEARTQAQEDIIAAQASAEAYRLQAEAEAREMQMKGYTYQQETQRQVATAAVSNGVGGGEGAGGGVSGIVGNIVDLGVGLGVMGQVVGEVKKAVNPVMGETQGIGQDVAKVMQEETWECPTCHAKNTGKFCPNCGTRKPEANKGWDCACGMKNIMTPFCPNCGAKKPEEPKGWDCKCGQKNIMTPFCPNCGAKKPEEPKGWDCSCGEKNIMTPFCPRCGKKREDN